MTAPAVSVITPTYNHERFIGACLESVLAQGFGAWEQIVLDDGSTDGTADVVRRFRDPRIRYVRQENLGIERLATTYNRALAACRAPLVAILEGDDTWPADKLETLVPAFADPEIVLAYGRTELVGDVPEEYPSVIPTAAFERCFGESALTNTPVGRAAAAMLDVGGLTFTFPCSVILRRSALEKIGGFQQSPGLLVTDHPTFRRIALEGRFHYERRTTGYWRLHENGTTVSQMDRIMEVLQRDVARFREEHADRLPLTDAAWRRITRGWDLYIGWMWLRQARRLLVEERWAEARPALARALTATRLATKLTALSALLGARLHFSVEPLYRLRGRPWYRRGPSGRAEIQA
jgi:glycosyltransferase involved in cell wall biosynthesis